MTCCKDANYNLILNKSLPVRVEQHGDLLQDVHKYFLIAQAHNSQQKMTILR